MEATGSYEEAFKLGELAMGISGVKDVKSSIPLSDKLALYLTMISVSFSLNRTSETSKYIVEGLFGSI